MKYCNPTTLDQARINYVEPETLTRYLKCSIVINAVCEYYGMSFHGIKRYCNLRDISDARHLAIYLTHKFHGDLVDREIGELFNRDRTSVIHSRKTAPGLIGVDPKVKRAYNIIIRKIRSNIKRNAA